MLIDVDGIIIIETAVLNKYRLFLKGLLRVRYKLPPLFERVLSSARSQSRCQWFWFSVFAEIVVWSFLIVVSLVLSIGCQQALILGHTRAKVRISPKCGHYGLATGDLPLAFVFEHMLSLSLPRSFCGVFLVVLAVPVVAGVCGGAVLAVVCCALLFV